MDGATMNDTPEILIGVPRGTPLATIVDEAIRPAPALSAGNKSQAARPLDVAAVTIAGRLKRWCADRFLRPAALSTKRGLATSVCVT
jgi:hypothetical protein